MRYALTAIGGVILIGASFLGARYFTINSLTNQNAIFDTFERVDANWLYSDRIGAPAASDVERARVAIGGPLALPANEAVYFVGGTDQQGLPLRSNCTYKVSGKPIDARWWSITLYDSETQHYVPNELNRSSWNSVSVPRSAAGEWVVNVSPTPKDTTWLPAQSEPGKSFELMLRIYNPSEATRALLPNIDLPSVEQVSC